MNPWVKGLGLMFYLFVIVPAAGVGIGRLLDSWFNRKRGP